MSYNISTWRTKELENLVIPLQSLYKLPNWAPEAPVAILPKDRILNYIDVKEFPEGEELFKIEGGSEGFLLMGTKHKTKFHIYYIRLYGDGSGTFWTKVLKPVLQQSTGKLIAARIWEGGDTVDKVWVQNGVVTEEEIEL